MSPSAKPSWRKPFGILLILLLIVLWAGIVVSLADWLPPLWWPLKAIFFIAAGRARNSCSVGSALRT